MFSVESTILLGSLMTYTSSTFRKGSGLHSSKILPEKLRKGVQWEMITKSKIKVLRRRIRRKTGTTLHNLCMETSQISTHLSPRTFPNTRKTNQWVLEKWLTNRRKRFSTRKKMSYWNLSKSKKAKRSDTLRCKRPPKQWETLLTWLETPTQSIKSPKEDWPTLESNLIQSSWTLWTTTATWFRAKSRVPATDLLQWSSITSWLFLQETGIRCLLTISTS